MTVRRRIRPPMFHGWWVVASVFVAEMFAIGSTSYAFGLFVLPVSEEFGLSRTAANMGLVLILLGMGWSAPVIGKALDRFPVRNVLVSGALMMGGGLVAVGLSQSVWVMALLLLLLVGPGAAAIGPLSAATVVSRWFIRRRGRALGITSVATSLGGTLLVPVIAFNLEWFGWRDTLLIQGAAVIVLVSIVTLLAVRDRPQDMGLQPDGDIGAVRDGVGGSDERRWAFGQILASRDFWCISLAIGLTFAVNQAVLVSLVPYALQFGVSAQNAALLVALISFFSILGKLAFGAVADRVDKRLLLLIIMAFIAMQVAFLLVAPPLPVLIVALAIGGLAVGGEFPVWQALVADKFGRISYGSVMGSMQLIVTFASLLSIAYAGYAYDVAGNYSIAFISFIGMIGGAMVFVLFISPSCMDVIDSSK